MGTNNLTCVVFNKKIRVAQYGQFDGQIKVSGLNILRFLESHNMEKFKTKINNCTLLDDDRYHDLPTKAGINHEKPSLTQEESKLLIYLNPGFERNLGYKILELIYYSQKNMNLLDASDFAAGIGCEWGYVIDLDTNKFEIYSGYTNERLTEEDRFFYLQNDKNSVIKKIAEYDINKLPSESEFLKFAEDIEKNDDYDDEVENENENDNNDGAGLFEKYPMKLIVSIKNNTSNYTNIETVECTSKEKYALAIIGIISNYCNGDSKTIKITCNHKVLLLLDI